MSDNIKDLPFDEIIKRIKFYADLKAKNLITEEQNQEYELLKSWYLEIVLK
ncbi:hypothetical protein [Mycoplasma mycoides]|uniref:Uncharacterized protein n=5 Tax=Mycoplasma mycoides TaxID=2102 RepID=Q6MTM8_MYCMS|nr:hypothetical protein [Mycoplasma mycoides]ADH21518.1 conserved hypothetical protein [synthetic Mycoplasma mycoides JCVI-syn1.0]AMW76431.1 hypothetical protein JCVISYN3_0315 [synthetic bacterium JCVI-Syn3.0]AMW76886.1 hypothetical protein JCVISYN2_0315 [synthetic bacterium JCVI-Syn2.0]AVX54717.1 Uncharacterized protein JCVISYN3A_0315 [synthetic bacterium JCVI-Syn3A]QWN46406.1 hypothetical protein JOY38_00805 [synthetic bacterium JCVI-Syn3B]CAE77008.1 hypothetical protein MSC_0373 [Mycoplasm